MHGSISIDYGHKDIIKELEEKYEDASIELKLQKGLTEHVQTEALNRSVLNESMISDVHAKVDLLIKTVEEKDSKIEDLEKTVLRMADQMKYMKLDLQRNEGARVQLFNMVQKLKGSMRVYIRVKPLDGTILPQTSSATDDD